MTFRMTMIALVLSVLASACATTKTNSTPIQSYEIQTPSWNWTGEVIVDPDSKNVYLVSGAPNVSNWEPYALIQSIDQEDEFLVPDWAMSELPITHFKLHPSGAVTAHVYIRGCNITLEVFPMEMDFNPCSIGACGEVRVVQIDHVLEFGPKDVCKQVLTNK